jgi:hypothetical protein
VHRGICLAVPVLVNGYNAIHREMENDTHKMCSLHLIAIQTASVCCTSFFAQTPARAQTQNKTVSFTLCPEPAWTKAILCCAKHLQRQVVP